jgi:pimeloyl-ACP methyl ester carboxylesterase
MPESPESSAVSSKETARANLEEQWSHPQELEIEGETLRIYDLDAGGSRNEKLDLPLLFAPGWIQNPKNHKEACFQMSETGCRVVVPDALHGIAPEKVEATKDANDIARAELRKAAMLLKTLDERNIPRADVVAHSEGAIYAAIAATAAPERFRNFVLVDPAGMIGKDSVLGLAIRSAREGGEDKKRHAREPFEVQLVGGKNKEYALTAGKTLAEVHAISKSDITDMLEFLRNKGINVSVMTGADDKFFPMEMMNKPGGPASVKNVRGFYSVKEGHFRLIQRPSQYARFVVQALEALASRKPRTISET